MFWWRDQVTDGRDDSWHANWLAEQGAELVRGEGRVLRKGVVAVGEREIEYARLVVATGSSPAVPPVEGLDEVEFWTNRDAVWANAVPKSLVVLGGGPVGAELAQFFHRLGSRVTILESHDHLLARLDPWPERCSASASRTRGSTSESRCRQSESARTRRDPRRARLR